MRLRRGRALPRSPTDAASVSGVLLTRRDKSSDFQLFSLHHLSKVY